MGNESFSEKVSVNINSSTLSSIDLLVDNGYYSNRSDFINQALRGALQQHQSTIDRIVDRNASAGSHGNAWFLGVSGYTRRELEEFQAAGEAFPIRGYGVLVLGSDLPEELIYSVIQSIQVKGKVLCSDAVKNHYGLK